MKRFIDIIISLFVLIIFFPLLSVIIFAVWAEDRKVPFYFGERAKLNGQIFNLVKIRSMIAGADKSGLESTSSHDFRITRVGHLIRKIKIDELPQFWNVLIGDMSIVGPRPNTISEIKKYNQDELRLLSVKPGITDFSSIVFADEGDILSHYSNADEAYTRIIRPWKSKLGLFYIDHSSNFVDLAIVFLTALNLVSRKLTLGLVAKILNSLGAPDELVAISRREKALT
jgi:lipopolysaccharide/colanic/teichoic acid biosynthesis glycosyltransferase